MNKTAIALALSAFAATPASANTFVNGDFETGTLAGWTGGGGSWFGSPPAPVAAATYNGGPSNNTITNIGTDSITGASTTYGGSNHAVRVNDSVNNYSVSTLQQTVTNYSDNDIFFAWNAVLDGSHGLTDSDYFSLTLHDDTTNTEIVNRSYSSAGDLGSGGSPVTWTSYPDPVGHQPWMTTGWVVENINLVALGAVGHDFTLTLLASDCPYGGHAGYVYLDGFGNVAPPPSVPEPASLALIGLGLAGLATMRRRKSA